MGGFQMWGSCLQKCMLVFTFALLLCEILVGRICHSLINMVDSFHTLYILIHISLYPSTMPAGISETSIVGSPNTPLPISESAHLGANSPFCKGYQYSKLRISPFGALISALLLVSLCVCITFEILSHLVQPHFIQHPLLATVVGIISLLFNTLVLVWKRCEQTNTAVKGLKRGPTETQSEPFTSEDKDTGNTQFETSTAIVKKTGLDGGTLMFCNLGAASVVDPDQGSQEFSSLGGSCPNASITPPVPQSNYTEKSISHDSTECQQSQQTIQPMDPGTEVANCSITPATLQPLRTELCTQMDSKHTRQKGGRIKTCIAVIRSLLGCVLVLVNGIILLLFKPNCLNCKVFAYLDPGFSMLTVLVLLATTMPELWHHGLLLLQAIPKHLSTEELMAHIGRVSGVSAVHELHVWQLSETCLVASVHVYCQSGLCTQTCSQLLVTVTEVLRGFGISHCTVQPEFIDSQVEEANLPMTKSAEQKFCSLRCEKECTKSMCCLSEENSVPSASPTLHMEVRQQVVIIENTYI
ncbi:proton-coupled zinc antiporter SLC30A1 [Trichomycterus rosablanca]|uniref:proton-coupled zinc antiporter SLC30A1 n=1 Tax=Trichomycterus rosablanca TaxID=2290929 RepID=UPI002F35984F